VTFSIVARDPHSGELGVGVQTAMFAVGASVPWCRPGVGAVATQAIGEKAYGERCLDALAQGATSTEALANASAQDPLATLRQVGVVGADGTVAATTGELCVDHAGHVVGDGFSVQANMVSSPDVWAAMADAFHASAGPLARRLYATLAAGAAAGGDARGGSSAAIVVVAGEPASTPGGGVVVDVRVDDALDPLVELGRLLNVAEAYALFDGAVDELMDGDPDRALIDVDDALRKLPGDENLRFVRAGALAASGDVDAAASELRALVAARPSWAVIVRSFTDKGLLSVPAGLTLDELGG
jgi:uncharacterized Ntn-hydrolase superfamily protein